MDPSNRWPALALCAGAALFSLPARADLRCGTKLVAEGAPIPEVRDSCGEPTTAERRVERTASASVGKDGSVTIHSGEITVDEWSYDFGPHEFVQYLRFVNGTLVSIVRGNYGRSR